MTYQLIRADARSLPLADNSVDLVITSPPYYALRSYRDGGEYFDGQIGSEATPQDFLEALWQVTAECKRVLKPSGSMFVNLGDKYAGSNSGFAGTSSQLHGKALRAANEQGRMREAVRAARRDAPDRYIRASGGVRNKSLLGLPWRYAIGCIDNLGLILRAEIVWSKPNGLPESVVDRVRRSHEQWFHLVKEPRYFSAIDEVREPQVSTVPYIGQRFNEANKGGTNGYTAATQLCAPNPLGKLPGSVWTIPSEPLIVPDEVGVEHFAPFPQEWPRRLILGWSPKGICEECREGRRPVTSVVYDDISPIASTNKAHADEQGNHFVTRQFGRASSSATITGYACACPEPTAPTRPAVILDPFCGTGTTVMVAHALGRHGIGVDLSRDYLRLAEWRITKSGHAHKSIARTWNEHVHEPTFFDGETA